MAIPVISLGIMLMTPDAIKRNPIEAISKFPELADQLDESWKDDRTKTVGLRMREMDNLALSILAKAGRI